MDYEFDDYERYDPEGIDTRYYLDNFGGKIFNEYKRYNEKEYIRDMQQLLNTECTDVKELEQMMEDNGLDLMEDESFLEWFEDEYIPDSDLVQELEEDSKEWEKSPYSYYGVSERDFH